MMIMTHARPPPRVAISHDAMQAKTMTAVLWYQSGSLSDTAMYREECIRTTEEFLIQLALEGSLVV
jgi:hypothetical protein